MYFRCLLSVSYLTSNHMNTYFAVVLSLNISEIFLILRMWNTSMHVIWENPSFTFILKDKNKRKWYKLTEMAGENMKSFT